MGEGRNVTLWLGFSPSSPLAHMMLVLFGLSAVRMRSYGLKYLHQIGAGISVFANTLFPTKTYQPFPRQLNRCPVHQPLCCIDN